MLVPPVVLILGQLARVVPVTIDSPNLIVATFVRDEGDLLGRWGPSRFIGKGLMSFVDAEVGHLLFDFVMEVEEKQSWDSQLNRGNFAVAVLTARVDDGVLDKDPKSLIGSRVDSRRKRRSRKFAIQQYEHRRGRGGPNIHWRRNESALGHYLRGGDRRMVCGRLSVGRRGRGGDDERWRGRDDVCRLWGRCSEGGCLIRGCDSQSSRSQGIGGRGCICQ